MKESKLLYFYRQLKQLNLSGQEKEMAQLHDKRGKSGHNYECACVQKYKDQHCSNNEKVTST